MSRPYEVVYIFDPALDEEAVNAKLTVFHTLVGAAESVQLNHWGRRALAYQIKKNDSGYYVVANFETDSTTLPEFERAIKLDDSVLRHLVVLNDEPPTPPNYAAVKPADSEEEDE
ncbi:MAG: 30S ribosomal protein S6 [Gemmatimonadales bacterium]